MERPYINDADAVVTAACSGDYDAVVYLLDRGAPIETRDERGCTALMAAVEEGYDGLARYLVERGADLNAPDELGDTPLAVARFRQHGELASVLESRGANAPAGPSARERREEQVSSALSSVDAARRLIDEIKNKRRTAGGGLLAARARLGRRLNGPGAPCAVRGRV